MSDWYKLSVKDVLARLGSGPEGLDQAEAAGRLAEYGPNELVERGIKSPWKILWEQLTGLMVIILIVAGVISGLIGEMTDTIAILAIVVLNALLGLSQEYRAEKAMAALKKLAVPLVRVRRGGQWQELSARELTPGDVVALEAGYLVPADCRLTEGFSLRVQEAALTGESEPVEKNAAIQLDRDVTLGDRINMAYMGTVITYGRATAVVVGTGMKTELGSIATMIQTVSREDTPLQKRLDQLGRWLAVAALFLVGLIFVSGLARSEELSVMFLTAVSMAVAAVPEGLPAVVTIALALGAKRMLARRALIRKLLAVETLGSVTVICSDKTGTLTENRMTVTVLDVADHQLDLTEHLHREGAVLEAGDLQQPILADRPALAVLLAGGALCNDAQMRSSDRQAGTFETLGDPTEGALVVAAARMGMWKDDLEKTFPRVSELAFDSDRKRMTTVHRCPPAEADVPEAFGTLWSVGLGLGVPKYLGITKGAVDSLLAVASHVWVTGKAQPLDAQWRQRIAATNDRLAQSGMRVLGVAVRAMESATGDGSLEQDLTFVGMVGMIDPPRREVKQAVLTCRAAGIRPVMITGDHPLTARHIAKELGIAEDGKVLTGAELDKMSIEQLRGVVEDVSVYARVSPEHKLNIVSALQSRGHIVAMTGDGVNDAPALKKADIGVAMGITGTDVSKEAADMVLQDDNFATIVSAVEEGRVIYDNIRKFIKYLLSCNSGELWVMLLVPFLALLPGMGHMPLPLLPLQILFMNLVTDGLPALALGVEPAERDIMRRSPFNPRQSIFGGGMAWFIVLVGLLMGVVSLFVAGISWQHDVAAIDGEAAKDHFRTMVFTTLTLSQMGLALAVRSSRDSLFRIGLRSNVPLLLAALATIALQLIVIYVPPVQGVFKTVALTAMDLALCLIMSTIPFCAVEIQKCIARRRK